MPISLTGKSKACLASLSAASFRGIQRWLGIQHIMQDKEGKPERGPMGIRMKRHLENLGLDTFPVLQVDLHKSAFQDRQCPPVFLI